VVGTSSASPMTGASPELLHIVGLLKKSAFERSSSKRCRLVAL
jgi:hypothetical protein